MAAEVEGPRQGWNLDSPKLLPTTTRPTPVDKLELAKVSIYMGEHQNVPEYFLTQATCCTCKRDVVRFVTTTGAVTTISEWQHQRGPNTHEVDLGEI